MKTQERGNSIIRFMFYVVFVCLAGAGIAFATEKAQLRQAPSVSVIPNGQQSKARQAPSAPAIPQPEARQAPSVHIIPWDGPVEGSPFYDLDDEEPLLK